LESARDIELEKLRQKILKAIRFSKRFWMTYREGTFGIASIINLIYKKSFIEVLFFTNCDVFEKAVPLLKIYTPIEDEIDFNEILFEPDFDVDGLIDPVKIIYRMRRLIRIEFQNHLKRLNTEVKLIDEKFENYQIKNNPYYREIGIYYPDFVITLIINLEKYPMLPTFSFSKSLSKIISEREFNELEIIKNWNVEDPPHVYEIVEKVCELVSIGVKIKDLKVNSQYLVLNQVSVGNIIDNLSFKIHRGKSIGIIFDEKRLENIDPRSDLLNLFDTIAGIHSDFSGSIEIFGNPMLLLTKEDKEKIFILPQAYDSSITKLRIKKALQYKINLNEIFKKKKSDFNLILRNAGLTQSLDEIMREFLKDKSFIFNRKRQYIKKVLESTGLLNKKNKKFSQLTPLEFLLFSITQALIQSPTIIMFSIPFGILGKLEYEKFNSYVNKIKENFHVVLIFHGPEEIISNCDKILTITKDTSKIGSLKDYIESLPQYGEILNLELNNPEDLSIQKLKEMKEIDVIIEERKNEKFKIFMKDSIPEVIIQIIELLGPSLHSFRRSTASIGEFLEFVESK
jgi:ABC-type multidrug transport system ATPase subunit